MLGHRPTYRCSTGPRSALQCSRRKASAGKTGTCPPVPWRVLARREVQVPLRSLTSATSSCAVTNARAVSSKQLVLDMKGELIGLLGRISRHEVPVLLLTETVTRLVVGWSSCNDHGGNRELSPVSETPMVSEGVCGLLPLADVDVAEWLPSGTFFIPIRSVDARAQLLECSLEWRSERLQGHQNAANVRPLPAGGRVNGGDGSGSVAPVEKSKDATQCDLLASTAEQPVQRYRAWLTQQTEHLTARMGNGAAAPQPDQHPQCTWCHWRFSSEERLWRHWDDFHHLRPVAAYAWARGNRAPNALPSPTSLAWLPGAMPPAVMSRPPRTDLAKTGAGRRTCLPPPLTPTRRQPTTPPRDWFMWRRTRRQRAREVDSGRETCGADVPATLQTSIPFTWKRPVDVAAADAVNDVVDRRGARHHLQTVRPHLLPFDDAGADDPRRGAVGLRLGGGRPGRCVGAARGRAAPRAVHRRAARGELADAVVECVHTSAADAAERSLGARGGCRIRRAAGHPLRPRRRRLRCWRHASGTADASEGVVALPLGGCRAPARVPDGFRYGAGGACDRGQAQGRTRERIKDGGGDGREPGHRVGDCSAVRRGGGVAAGGAESHAHPRTAGVATAGCRRRLRLPIHSGGLGGRGFGAQGGARDSVLVRPRGHRGEQRRSRPPGTAAGTEHGRLGRDAASEPASAVSAHPRAGARRHDPARPRRQGRTHQFGGRLRRRARPCGILRLEGRPALAHPHHGGGMGPPPHPLQRGVPDHRDDRYGAAGVGRPGQAPASAAAHTVATIRQRGGDRPRGAVSAHAGQRHAHRQCAHPGWWTHRRIVNRGDTTRAAR
eukprot:ctg_313.g177